MVMIDENGDSSVADGDVEMLIMVVRMGNGENGVDIGAEGR